MAQSEGPSEALRQGKSARNSSGSRESKSLSHNKNRSLEAPPMPNTEGAPHKSPLRLGTRGHGAFSAKIVNKVLSLTSQGLSLSQISQIAGMPTARALRGWRQEYPEFAEDVETEYNGYVDDQAKQMLPLAAMIADEHDLERLFKQIASMGRVKGLKPTEKLTAIDKMVERKIQAATALANARDKRIQRTLQIAASRDPSHWGKDTIGGGETIVMDLGLGTLKELNLPGSRDGQNAAALAAQVKKE